MNDRKTLAISEMKVEKWYAQDGKCATCGIPLSVPECELAHRIPQRKWCIAKWGPGVIHHRMNVALTHHGACNDKVSIGNQPVKMDALAEEIRKERGK